MYSFAGDRRIRAERVHARSTTALRRRERRAAGRRIRRRIVRLPNRTQRFESSRSLRFVGERSRANSSFWNVFYGGRTAGGGGARLGAERALSFGLPGERRSLIGRRQSESGGKPFALLRMRRGRRGFVLLHLVRIRLQNDKQYQFHRGRTQSGKRRSRISNKRRQSPPTDSILVPNTHLACHLLVDDSSATAMLGIRNNYLD